MIAVDLAVGQDFRDDVVDAGLPRDGLRRRAAIAGQHHARAGRGAAATTTTAALRDAACRRSRTRRRAVPSIAASTDGASPASVHDVSDVARAATCRCSIRSSSACVPTITSMAVDRRRDAAAGDAHRSRVDRRGVRASARPAYATMASASGCSDRASTAAIMPQHRRSSIARRRADSRRPAACPRSACRSCRRRRCRPRPAARAARRP